MSTIAPARSPGASRPGGFAGSQRIPILLGAGGAATLLGEAAIHLAAMPAHFSQWGAAGAFFVLLSVTEVVSAAGILLRPSRNLWLAVGAAGLATMTVWAVSRVWGMPLGPGAFRPEPIGLPDYICTCLEAATVVVAVVAASSYPIRGQGSAPPLGSAHRLGRHVLVAAVVEISLVALLVTTGAVWSELHRSTPMAPTRMPPVPTPTSRSAVPNG